MSLQLDVPTKQKENNDGKKGDDNDNANDDSRDNNVGKPGSWQGWNYGDALRWPTLWRTFFGRQQGLNGRIAISPVCQPKKWVRKLGWQGGQCRPQQICFLTTHYILLCTLTSSIGEKHNWPLCHAIGPVVYRNPKFCYVPGCPGKHDPRDKHKWRECDSVDGGSRGLVRAG